MYGGHTDVGSVFEGKGGHDVGICIPPSIHTLKKTVPWEPIDPSTDPYTDAKIGMYNVSNAFFLQDGHASNKKQKERETSFIIDPASRFADSLVKNGLYFLVEKGPFSLVIEDGKTNALVLTPEGRVFHAESSGGVDPHIFEIYVRDQERKTVFVDPERKVYPIEVTNDGAFAIVPREEVFGSRGIIDTFLSGKLKPEFTR